MHDPRTNPGRQVYIWACVCCVCNQLAYHYIRKRGLGGDGPEDIISSCSKSFPSYAVTSRNYKLCQKGQITFGLKTCTTESAGSITVTDTSVKVEVQALAPFSH